MTGVLSTMPRLQRFANSSYRLIALSDGISSVNIAEPFKALSAKSPRKTTLVNYRIAFGFVLTIRRYILYSFKIKATVLSLASISMFTHRIAPYSDVAVLRHGFYTNWRTDTASLRRLRRLGFFSYSRIFIAISCS